MPLKNLEKYNSMWLEGHELPPLVILIGGYCGTGKSVSAMKLIREYPYIHNVKVDIIRAVLRSVITKEENPSLHKHTYDLYTLVKSGSSDVKALRACMDSQCKPCSLAINEYIEFAQTEGQATVMEGPQVFPGFIKYPENYLVVEAYLKVDDGNTHYEFMLGPTHHRNMSKEQFESGRILQEYILESAKKYRKEIIDYKNAYNNLLNLVDSRIGKFFISI